MTKEECAAEMIREDAITFAARVLTDAKDWQEAEHALADHAVFGPHLEIGGNPVGEAQSIIREAEQRLSEAGVYI